MSVTARPTRISIAAQKPSDRSFFRRALAVERGLQRGELVVGLIAEQHAEAHVDHHRQQQHAQQRPHRNALAALEIVAGDAPELAAPCGEPRRAAPGPPGCTPPRSPKPSPPTAADVISSSPQFRDGVNVSMPGSYPARRYTRAGFRFALHPAESPFAVAEQFEFVRVVLLDRSAVADADQNGVRQLRAHQVVAA